LNKKDVYQFFYGILSGVISLSLPLGIQAITNFIQSGRASAWIVLIVLVVFGVALVGVFVDAVASWKTYNKKYLFDPPLSLRFDYPK
jgi:hypothetical protein